MRFEREILSLIENHDIETVLDYGCGKGALSSKLAVEFALKVAQYDPGVPQLAKPPRDPADLVICTDVLEHVEVEKLSNVLNHIRDLTKKVAYFVVHTGDCGNKLADGSPAHITQMARASWEVLIGEVFKGFSLGFIDTGLPHRFQVIAINDGKGLVESDLIPAGITADPEPDMSAIEALEASEKGGVQTGMMARMTRG